MAGEAAGVAGEGVVAGAARGERGDMVRLDKGRRSVDVPCTEYCWIQRIV